MARPAEAIVPPPPDIPGGNFELEFSEAPYLVSVIIDYGTAFGQCSGSLLDTNVVVTAAHCFVTDGANFPGQIDPAILDVFVLVGPEVALDHPEPEVVYARYGNNNGLRKGIKIHGNYVGDNFKLDRDIAVIILEEDTVTGDTIGWSTAEFDVPAGTYEDVFAEGFGCETSDCDTVDADADYMDGRAMPDKEYKRPFYREFFSEDPTVDRFEVEHSNRRHIPVVFNDPALPPAPAFEGVAPGDSGGPLISGGVVVGVLSFATTVPTATDDVDLRAATFMDIGRIGSGHVSGDNWVTRKVLKFGTLANTPTATNLSSFDAEARYNPEDVNPNRDRGQAMTKARAAVPVPLRTAGN